MLRRFLRLALRFLRVFLRVFLRFPPWVPLLLAAAAPLLPEPEPLLLRLAFAAFPLRAVFNPGQVEPSAWAAFTTDDAKGTAADGGAAFGSATAFNLLLRATGVETGDDGGVGPLKNPTPAADACAAFLAACTACAAFLAACTACAAAGAAAVTSS